MTLWRILRRKFAIEVSESPKLADSHDLFNNRRLIWKVFDLNSHERAINMANEHSQKFQSFIRVMRIWSIDKEYILCSNWAQIILIWCAFLVRNINFPKAYNLRSCVSVDEH